MTDKTLVLRPIQRTLVLYPKGRTGERGPAGTSGGTVPPISFTYGEAPHDVFNAPSAGRVVLSRIGITEAFDGSGAQITIGTNSDHDALISADDNDPMQIGQYETVPDFDLSEGDGVRIYITPGTGATQGAGFLFIEFVPF
jgi:hypothetical protein